MWAQFSWEKEVQVKEGLIHEVGTIKEAIAKLHELIEKNKHVCYTKTVIEK